MPPLPTEKSTEGLVINIPGVGTSVGEAYKAPPKIAPVSVLGNLQDQGYDPNRINKIIGGVRKELNSQGVSNFDIDKKLGIAPFDTSAFQEFMVDQARSAYGEDMGAFTRDIFTLDDFLQVGFEKSTVSLAVQPQSEGAKRAEHMKKSILQESAMALGTVTGDLPAIVTGFIGGTGVGTPTGPGAMALGVGAAFALPEVIRTLQMDAYENGTPTSFKQFWDLLTETTVNGAKAYVTGAATGATGGVLNPLLKGTVPPTAAMLATLAAEVNAFTTVGAALDGRIAEPREYAVGLLTVLGIKTGTTTAGKISQTARDIYRHNGTQPRDIVRDMAIEPSIAEDIASINIDVPRVYKTEVDMSRRNFIKGSAAVMATLAIGGKIKLAELPRAVNTGSETSLTIMFEGGQGGGQILFPSSMQSILPKSFKTLEITGDVKTLEEAKTLLLEAGEEVSIVADKKSVSFVDLRKMNEQEVQEYLGSIEGSDLIVMDPFSTGINRNLKELYKESIELFGDKESAAEIVSEFTEGKYVIDPATGEVRSGDAKFFKNAAKELEKAAEQEETAAIEANLPRQQIEPPVEQKLSANEIDAKADARISVGETEPGKKLGLHDIYTAIFDDLHPLSQVVKSAAEGSTWPANKDPYVLARNLKGVSGVGDSFLEFGALDYATKSRTTEPLRDIIRPINDAGDMVALNRYLVARRDLELIDRGIETGADRAEAADIVSRHEKKFEDAAARIDVWNEALLKYVKDSGIISEEAYVAMREANKDFVPFNRVMDPGKGGGTGLRSTTPIKGIKGSERRIVDPIESMIKNAYVLSTLAERNRTFNALIELSELRPDLGIATPKKATNTVTKVESTELQKLLEPYMGEGELGMLSEADISVFRSKVFINDKDIVRFKDGKAEVYEVNGELATALAGMDRAALDVTIKILALPASMLRTGAILTPEFMAMNATRDTLSAFLYSKDGFVPIVHTFTGMGHVLGRTNAYKDWVASGGQFAHIQAIDRTYHQKGMKELLQSIPMRNVVRNPIEILRAMSSLVEQGTRVQVFKNRYNKAVGKEGKPRIEALTEAGFESRDVTLDFQKFGTKTRSLNQISAFFNAWAQGGEKMVRSFVNNPVAMTAKVTAGLVLPSVGLHLVNRDKEWYKDLPQWRRDLYWNFDTGTEGTDDHIIWKIPKPFDVGLIFGTGAEVMVENMIGNDPRAAMDFLESVGTAVVPNLMPQALTVPIEVWSNKSMFLDRPIVPRSRENMLPEYQYGIYTSETAKQIGRLVGKLPPVAKAFIPESPAVIDHVVRGWTGGLGKHALDLIDKVLVASGIAPDTVEATPAALTDVPLVKAFVTRYPSLNTKTIERFYDAYEKQEVIINTYRKLLKEGNIQEARKVLQDAKEDGGIYRLTQQKNALSNMSKAIQRINLIQNMEGLTRDQLSDWKRENIDALYIRMNQIAKRGLKIVDKHESLPQN